jgi:hypothetical protein
MGTFDNVQKNTDTTKNSVEAKNMNASDFIGTASKETKDEINKNFE